MVGTILTTPEDNDGIRALVGVPADVIPDGVIALLPYLPYVEGEVELLVPDYVAIVAADDQETKRLKLGVMAWVAARLCLHVKREEGRRYQIDDFGQRANAVKWDQHAEGLVQESAAALGSLTAAADPGQVPLMVVTGPTSSGEKLPTEFSEWVDIIQPSILDWLEGE